MTTSAQTTLMRQLTDLTQNERLIPILPMIYVAWSDGDLTDDEIRQIRGTAADQEWLDSDAKDRLARWLDPEDPPKPRTMSVLLRSMQQAADELPEDERFSLAELGVEIAKLEAEAEGDVALDGWLQESTRDALRDLEEALGIASEEACRELLSDVRARPKAPVDEPDPAFEIGAMTRALDGAHHETW
ncbi:MAG: hypothetical protein ABEN55_07865, partial [Bradymonadaceae bacterium]